MRSSNIETNRFNPAGVFRAMRARPRTVFGLTFVSALCCLASAAHAGTVYETASIYLADQGPSGQSGPVVTLFESKNAIVTQPNLDQGGAVDWSQLTQVNGPDNFTFVGNPLQPANSTSFISFCIELTQDISLHNPYKVNVVSLASAPMPQSGPIGQNNTGMGDTAAGLIEQLWTDHFHDIFYTGTNPNNQTTQDVNAAAFQLAIWKLEYDGGKTFDFGSGYLQVGDGDKDTDDANALNNASVKLASTWLNGIKSNDPRANLLAITGDPSGTNFQDQVVALPPGVPPPPGSVVPEPSSLVLCGLAVVGMAAARRGRGRRRGQ